MIGDTPSTTQKRRTRERWIVFLVFFLVLFFGFIEGWFYTIRSDLPMTGNILLFALINVNVILLLLLFYLVLRNIVKLIFERKRNILGHKLRTRLVLAFTGLTLIPTIPLFWLATQFIFSSLDHWFSRQVEYSLEQSVALSRDYLEQAGEDLTVDAQALYHELTQLYLQGVMDLEHAIQREFEPLKRHHVHAAIFMNGSQRVLATSSKARLTAEDTTRIMELNWEYPQDYGTIRSVTLGNNRESLVLSMPYPPHPDANDQVGGAVLLVRILPSAISQRIADISSGYEDYLQLKLLHSPFKKSNFIAFCIITLLVLFSAIWFAFFLAKGITDPIQSLVWATQRIAQGNMNVELQPERQDEFGMLMDSFNKMVRDLKESRAQLNQAYSQLQLSHTELEERRRYMEIILKNVAAGVVSVDSMGRIVTMNKSAEALFGINAEEVRDQSYESFFEPQHFEILNTFMQSHQSHPQHYLEQQVHTIVKNRPAVLLIKASLLYDEKRRYMGAVVVLDDLTDLEKAQRMAAWREVARRIAHEIKNPLTPIRLCAQRLNRRYQHRMGTEDPVFAECTSTIIEQVDRMKYLVDEFSTFARLPRTQPVLCDLPALVEETLTLYRHSHPHIRFSINLLQEPPLIKLDRDQIIQALINLLENATHAIGEEKGTIEIRIHNNRERKVVTLECADSGIGLSPENKLRMFEPYYSGKEKGTGLGLAIVASIIEDHNGFVRVRDNEARGTVIVIELPAPFVDSQTQSSKSEEES